MGIGGLEFGSGVTRSPGLVFMVVFMVVFVIVFLVIFVVVFVVVVNVVIVVVIAVVIIIISNIIICPSLEKYLMTWTIPKECRGRHKHTNTLTHKQRTSQQGDNLTKYGKQSVKLYKWSGR